MNAQLKPNEQALQEFRLNMRRSDVLEINRVDKDRDYRRECLLEHIGDHVRACLDDILENHGTDDEAQNGRILSNAIASFVTSLITAKMTEELREEFLPSWRSRSEP